MNSTTKLLGVIGDPISHSKSPLMMNRALATTGLNFTYAAFHVSPADLGQAIAGVRALQFRGINVTIPHKETVIPFLDELDESAQLIGAVNTIVNNQGRLIGYNTDGIGYARSLIEETGISLAGKKVLVLGAGGAARAIVYALAKHGVNKIYLVNRSQERAVELAQHFTSLVEIQAIAASEIRSVASDVDLLINTTSVGMSPNESACPLDDMTWFHDGLTVSDLIYNPRMTNLLEKAKRSGATIHGGLGMLVYQGAYAFEYWTGQTAPIEAMWQGVTQ